MDIGLKTLSEIVTFNKYAKYIPSLKRRETYDEIVFRYLQMMVDKYPLLAGKIMSEGQYILDKKILPSMRALQFAGPAIQKNEARIYNCCYLPIDDYRAFSEIMFLLLGGTGVGYSVQFKHIEKLPAIKIPHKEQKFLISDSIEGWADAIKHLIGSYLGYRNTRPRFDFSDIRQKGARLITAGGKAPGPEPLKECLFKIQQILDRKLDNEKLSTIEVHDIICHIADSVLAGGIRRAALISLFSADDEDMLTCKFGNWWEQNPQRGRANNSAVLVRHRITKEFFLNLWKKIELSGSGEPGFYFTNNPDWGTNPCCFTGDTKILTHEGYKPIKECVGENLFINKDNEIVTGLVWSTGVKHTIELVLSNKTRIECTPDHRFMASNGATIEAIDSQGLRLMPHYTLNNEVSEFTKYGFIQGDGGLGRLDSTSHKGLEINIGSKDEDIFELFGINKEKNKKSYYVNGFNEILRTLRFDSSNLPQRRLPSTFIFWDSKDKLMFLKGMYSANGSIIKNQRISYKTTSFQLAAELVDVLSSFNIKAYVTTNKEKEVEFSNGSYMCKESYDINISRFESVLQFAKLIGFVHKYKQSSLEELILEKAPKVMHINIKGNQEVFDFSLDDEKHWGVIEGVIAHNCEIALRPYQFCNLCEVNVSNVESQADLNNRVAAAAFFGTLQAGFTDFHYLRPIWKKTTEKDALVGIGMTGIASMEVFKYDLTEAANMAELTNIETSQSIGINRAARITCVKPSGTTSCVLGTASGIHAWHNDYYIRRMQLSKNEDLYKYLETNHPELVKDHLLIPNSAVIEIPIKAPEGSVLRTETALDTLERVKKVSRDWIKPGHITGDNTHNVSATISIDKSRRYSAPHDISTNNKFVVDSVGDFDEWEVVGEWMWDNKEFYNGLSVLPYDGGTYSQAPFEDITKEQYEELVQKLSSIDLTQVIEEDDLTSLMDQAACAGPMGCDVK